MRKRLVSDDFELELLKDKYEGKLHQGKAYCNTNSASVAKKIKKLDKTTFLGGTTISVIAKLSYMKRDKYQITLKGFN